MTTAAELLVKLSSTGSGTVAGDLGRVDRAQNQLGGNAGKMGAAVKKGMLAGVAGVTALGALGTKALNDFAESAAVTAQTGAVIKSTGGIANVTAKDVDTLATALSKKAAVDDEVVASGANMLLTFTNIRNEAGRGNDVFDQTVQASLDLARAMGTDAKSAAMQLGKALNDPVKGVTKLTRSGVTFTEQQKDQIAALQESGDILGAQKIILAEVNKEFGGSAAAFAKTAGGTLERLKITLGNTMEDIGGAIAPAASDILGALEPLIPVLGDALGKAAAGIAPILGIVAEQIAAILPPLMPVISALASGLEPVLRALLPALVPIVNVLAQGLGEVLIELAPPLAELARLVSDLLVALTPLLPPLVQILAAMIKFGLRGIQPLVILLQHTLVPAVQTVARWLTSLLETVAGVFSGVMDWLGRLRQTVFTKLLDVVDFFRELPGKIVSFLAGLPRRLWELGGNVVQGLIDGIKSAGGRVLDALKSLIPAPLRGALSFIFGRSPSPMFEGFGRNMIDGLVRGLEHDRSLDRALRDVVHVPAITLPAAGARGVDGASMPALVAGTGGAGTTIYVGDIIVQGGNSDEETARRVVKAIQRLESRSGPILTRRGG